LNSRRAAGKTAWFGCGWCSAIEAGWIKREMKPLIKAGGKERISAQGGGLVHSSVVLVRSGRSCESWQLQVGLPDGRGGALGG